MKEKRGESERKGERKGRKEEREKEVGRRNDGVGGEVFGVYVTVSVM